MKKIYSLLFLLAVSSVSFGQVFSEDFNYADNAVLTANGYVAHSGAGTNAVDVGASNGLSYTGYSGLTGFTAAVEGNAARLDNTGEDVNKTFTAPVTSGTLYYTFLINVTAADATGGYFTHFGPGGTPTSPFAARVFVKNSATTGKINFGASNSSTAVYGTTDFDLNTTYLIILKYDVSTTGALSMWVKATGVPATEAAAGTAEVTTSGSGTASVNAVYLRQYNAAQNITMDGIRVYTTWFGATPCALTLGTEAAVCDAVTLGLDTYTTTIPFTGGGSGTYNLGTTAGTISGDNPSTTAAGNIIISGVTEGTNFTLTVSGSCGFTKIVTAPECKPINTLPFTDSFPYTAGNSLNGEQKWTVANTGDNITVAAGNLSYTGITSAGNSITFVGTGAESRTLFTNTTSGTLFASFIATASDLANVTTDLTSTYFALFTDNTGGSTNARVWIRKNGTQYQYGLGTGSTATDWDPTLYNANDIQYVVLGYDFGTNTLSLIINPTIGGTASPAVSVTPTTAFTGLGGFMFRQDVAGSTPTMLIDELRIDTTPNFTLGKDSFNAIAGLKMYPNPVSTGTIYINSDANNVERTVVIYDILGKQVVNTTTASDEVNVAKLHSGLYIVKITEDGKTATRKLVIK